MALDGQAAVWQPIEAAPKDGTWIVAQMKDGTVWEIQWNPKTRWTSRVLWDWDVQPVRWIPRP